MIDLTTFTMGKMTELSIKLRKLGDASHSMEETAQKLVRCFYDNIKDPDSGKNALALVRFFTTFNYHDLSPDLQAFSDTVLSIDPVSRCWPARETSRNGIQELIQRVTRRSPCPVRSWSASFPWFPTW